MYPASSCVPCIQLCTLHPQACAPCSQVCPCMPRYVPYFARCVSGTPRVCPGLPGELTPSWPRFPLQGTGQCMVGVETDQVSLRRATDTAAWASSRLCSCSLNVMQGFSTARERPSESSSALFHVQEPRLHVKTRSLSWPSLPCFPGKTRRWDMYVHARGRREDAPRGKEADGGRWDCFPAKSWAPLAPLSCWPQGSLGRRMRAVPSPSLSL